MSMLLKAVYLGQQCIAAPAWIPSIVLSLNGNLAESTLMISGTVKFSANIFCFVSPNMVGDKSAAMTRENLCVEIRASTTIEYYMSSGYGILSNR